MDLRNKLPGETFQYLVNIENGQLYTGTGSLITSLTITNITASHVTESFATQSFADIMELRVTHLTGSEEHIISSLIDNLTASVVSINPNIVFSGSSNNPFIYLAGNSGGLRGSISTSPTGMTLGVSSTGSIFINSPNDLYISGSNLFVTGGYVQAGFLFSQYEDTSTNTAPVSAEINHTTTAGTPVALNGVSLDLTMNSDTTARQVGTRIGSSWIDATQAGRTARVRFFLPNSGSLNEALSILPTSAIFSGSVTASAFAGSLTGSFESTSDLVLHAHSFTVSSSFIDVDGFVSNARDSLTSAAPVAGEFTHQLNTGTAAAGHGASLDLSMDTSDGSHRVVGTRLGASWLTASAAGKTAKFSISQYLSGSFAERFNINPTLATFSTQVTANGLTGSHFGTSSWATNAKTSSMQGSWGYLSYDGTTLVTNTFNATVTRGAVGSYNVLFQNALSSGQYAVIANAHSGSSDASATGSIMWARSQTTTGFTMSCQKVTDFTTLSDFTTGSFTVFSY